MGSKCGNCQKDFFPPRVICPICHRKSFGKMEKIKIEGNARLVSYSVIHEAPEGFKMLAPYVLGIVEFKDGVRTTGHLVDCDPESIEIGMEVTPVFRKVGEEGASGVIHYGYKFKPVV